MDVVLLSRIQFALTIGFHFLFPPISIGLGLILVIMEGMYIKTGKPQYRAMTQFWMKIFALVFALGVATGLVQVFAFGNNWARFSKFVGDVFGSALAAEGIFAFFLESGFLGLMLFGWDRIGKKMHYFSTICVCLGAHFSAVWIIVANSWMQTPAGYSIVGEGEHAHAHVTNFWQMVFNHSTLDRLSHVIIACWITGAFLVLSVSAYYYLRKRHLEFARVTMKIGLIVASVSLVLQLISSDFTARGVAKNQPEKLAAIEGVYKTQEHTPMTLIGYVDKENETVKGLKAPSLLSWLVYRNGTTAVTGLDQFAKEDRPNTPVVFQTYHLMIYLWVAMVILVVAGIFFWNRKTLEKAKWTLRGLMIAVVFPHLANEAGWFTAEMGRQPWIVYHVLRTSQGVSGSIHPGYVIGSIIMFIVIYSLLFCLFLFLLNRKIKHGPEEVSQPKPADQLVYRDVYQ